MHDAALAFYLPSLNGRAKGTVKSYWRDTYKKHVEPAIGHLPYDEVRKYHIVNMINGLKREDGSPIGVSKVQAVITVTKAIFKELLENRFIDHNPAESIKMPNRKSKKVDLKINESDVNLQLSICPPHMVPVLLLGSVGLRIGEIAGFRWEQISGNKITVNNQRLKDGTYSLPKREHIREFEVSTEFLESLRQFGNQDSGFVSTSQSGRPWSLSRLSADFKALGFPAGVGAHQMRHLAATIMVQKNLLAAQKVLGHLDLATTQKYTHLESVDTKDTLTNVYPDVVRGDK